MLKFITSALLLIINFAIHAQSLSTSIGARAGGMGNTSSCVDDEWALFNNIGGLSKTQSSVAAFSYESRPSLTGANRMAFAFGNPMKVGVAGFGFYKFGDNLYSEQIITTGYSNAFGLASLGIKFNYVQYRIEGFGTRSMLTVSAGGIAQLTPRLAVGAYITNINQPKLSNDEGQEYLPTVLTVGLGIKASDKVSIVTEVEKDLDYKSNIKAGLEYKAHQKIIFRTGFNTFPSAGYFGIGFRPKKFKLDYSFRYEPNLGGSHQATVAYIIRSK